MAKVQVAYLLSYEHMGKVQISCASGCECESAVVDAHERNFMQSVRWSRELLVTMSEACVIRLEVLHDTSSGEHKFKLEHITASAEIASSEYSM